MTASRRPHVRRWHSYVPGPLRRADAAAYRRVLGMRSRRLDAVMPPLSRAADRSLAWIVMAGAFAATGPRGRRAAVRGLACVAATSFVANLPGKLIGGRGRPDPLLVPSARRLVRIPTSSSFPSGHAASAFAFAVGAGAEAPAAAPALTALAAAVAFSRVYTGVHYPGDVAAGALLGATIAAASTKVRPVRRTGARAVHRTPVSRIDAPVSRDGEGLVVLVNPRSGSDRGADAAGELRDALPGARIIELNGGDVAALARREGAVSSALGVAGGDGTMEAVAEAALELGVPLMAVPAGTLNHLTRDLGVDDVGDAVEGVRSGTVLDMDVGRIGGRVFLNTASFGVYTDLVDRRERLERRLGKWAAMVVALASVLVRGRPVDVVVDGERKLVLLAFIGNCRYTPDGVAPACRERLDDETLDVRLADVSRSFARVRLLAAALTGRLERSKVYERRLTTSLRVRSLEGPLRLAVDGETFDGPAEFTVTKTPRGLRVFVPR